LQNPPFLGSALKSSYRRMIKWREEEKGEEEGEGGDKLGK